jgi:hypothetical protein
MMEESLSFCDWMTGTQRPDASEMDKIARFFRHIAAEVIVCADLLCAEARRRQENRTREEVTIMEESTDFFDWVREIQRSDAPEIDKLTAFFGRITTQIVDYGEKEIEAARALHDRETLVKVQIKMETMKTARAIFNRGYQVATGRMAWDEQDKR